MNRIFNVVVIIIFNRINCSRLNNNNYVSLESSEGNNEINHILYSHEEIDESIDNNINYNKTDYSFEEIASSTPTTVMGTTTEEVRSYNHQNNITAETDESYESQSQSTLIDFPFAVSIQRKGAHYASGALVGKSWILTAAGEFYNVRESIKLFRARLGSVDCKRGGTLVPLKSINIHPSYTYRKPNYDVALLRMAGSVQYNDFIRPISVSNLKGKVLNAKFLTTYWPRIVVNDVVLPETANERLKHNSMRVSTQNLIAEDKCLMVMKSLNEALDTSIFCLQPVTAHHSVCMPDVGAPVVAEDGLWAITSGWVSPSCPLYPGPTLSTRVSSFLVNSWLNSHLLDL